MIFSIGSSNPPPPALPPLNSSESNKMELQPDFKELLALFNAHRVEYLIVGAYALAFHGAPRYTGDIDLLVCPSVGNAKAILPALSDFGFASLGLQETDFLLTDRVIQLGVPPVRVDLLTSLTGLSWEEANAHRVSGQYGDVPVHFIGKTEYIRNKKATGRKKTKLTSRPLALPPPHKTDNRIILCARHDTFFRALKMSPDRQDPTKEFAWATVWAPHINRR